MYLVQYLEYTGFNSVPFPAEKGSKSLIKKDQNKHNSAWK